MLTLTKNQERLSIGLTCSWVWVRDYSRNTRIGRSVEFGHVHVWVYVHIYIFVGGGGGGGALIYFCPPPKRRVRHNATGSGAVSMSWAWPALPVVVQAS